MIASIVAIAKNGVIGKKGAQLPWKIPEELKLFKAITTGNVIVMGRKTYESIGRPLPNRVNVVISRQMDPVEGVEVFTTIKEALDFSKKTGKDIFIIGGADIFSQTKGIVDKFYISHLKKAYEGDTFFPELDLKSWKVEKRKDHGEFEFVVYSRK